MPELFGDQGSRWPLVPPLSVTFESGRGGGEGPCAAGCSIHAVMSKPPAVGK